MKATSNNTRFAIGKTLTHCFGFGSEATNLCPYGGQPPDYCTYHSCQDYDTTSDIVYEINPTSGAISNFVSNHRWGPYQMIFVPF
jgi:hypothetical protein